jgi:UDP-N-acetyl-D-mannosaminuronate dehydrogenase
MAVPISAVIAAVQSAAAYLQPETQVSLESTTYPGLTDDVVRPSLEASDLVAGVDFNLAFSPERIDPGNQEFGPRKHAKGDQRPHRERRRFLGNLSKRSCKGRVRPK